MRFPSRAQEIVDQFYSRERRAFEESDDTRRGIVRLIAEQLAFELGPHYGNKAATHTNPQGPSTIAYESTNGTLGGWRVIDGDGSVTGIANAPLPDPPWQSFAGQMFIARDPIDHLGISAMPDPPAPLPSPPVVVEPPAPATPAPALPPPAPSPLAPTAGGLQGVLTAAGAWLGTQLGTMVWLWLQRKKSAPPKPGPVGSAIPRPTMPTRTTLPK